MDTANFRVESCATSFSAVTNTSVNCLVMMVLVLPVVKLQSISASVVEQVHSEHVQSQITGVRILVVSNYPVKNTGVKGAVTQDHVEIAYSLERGAALVEKLSTKASPVMLQCLHVDQHVRKFYHVKYTSVQNAAITVPVMGLVGLSSPSLAGVEV